MIDKDKTIYQHGSLINFELVLAKAHTGDSRRPMERLSEDFFGPENFSDGAISSSLKKFSLELKPPTEEEVISLQKKFPKDKLPEGTIIMSICQSAALHEPTPIRNVFLAMVPELPVSEVGESKQQYSLYRLDKPLSHRDRISGSFAMQSQYKPKS